MPKKVQFEVSQKGSEKVSGKFGKLNKSLINMAKGALGAVAAIYALKKGFEFVTRVGGDFQQEMANLKAISGGTTAELKKLDKQARALGSTTKFTATQVAELQVQYAKLGFTADEIEKVAEGTLALAAAAGENLAASAAVAGATLRGFRLEASETNRVTDVMAKSFASSALDLMKFTESMKLVAPAASAFGFNVEQTTTLLGKLADAGIDSSIAGTGLQAVMMLLADKSSKLNKLFGGSVQTYDQLVDALKELKKGNFDLGDATEYLDRRSAKTFLTLVNQSDELDTLKEKLDNAAGSAESMAKIQMETFKGATLELNSALEGMGIKLFNKVEPGLTAAKKAMAGFISSLGRTELELTIESFKKLGVESEALLGLQKIQLERNIIRLNTELTITKAKYDNIADATKRAEDINKEILVIETKKAKKIVEIEKISNKILEYEMKGTENWNKQQRLIIERAGLVTKLNNFKKEEIRDLQNEAGILEKNLNTLIEKEQTQKEIEVIQEAINQGAEEITEETKKQVEAAKVMVLTLDQYLEKLGYIINLRDDFSAVFSVARGELKKTEEELSTFWTEDFPAIMGQASSTLGSFSSYQSTLSQNRIREYRDEATARIAAVENSTKSEAQKEKEIAAIKSELREQEKDELQKLKGVKYAQAITNTAVGVTGALGMQPWTPINFILAGLVAAAGAVEIATIAAQKYGKGGEFITTGATPIIVGEAGREHVKITPMDRGGIAPSQNTFNFYGDVYNADELVDKITPILEERSRLGFNQIAVNA